LRAFFYEFFTTGRAEFYFIFYGEKPAFRTETD